MSRVDERVLIIQSFFMPNSSFKSFIFNKPEFDQESRTIKLHYSLDNKIDFTETFQINFEIDPNYSKKAMQKTLYGLSLACGVSYYKAFLPDKIKYAKDFVAPNKSQAEFFTKLYKNGLGEFLIQNKLNFEDIAEFSYVKKDNNAIKIKNNNGNIVPIGGGKDSLTTATILTNAGQKFDTWTVGQYDFLNSMISKVHQKQNKRSGETQHLQIIRKISPKLIELNKNGFNGTKAYNGHIPISSILAFLSMFTLIIRNKKNAILSNESSANEGNTTLDGLNVNHQYSKSVEFEKDFQEYVKKHISADINYFSLLRPWSEAQITKYFANNCWSDYKNDFISCNSNFRTSNGSTKSNWCCKCPKCAFVFAMLSAQIEKDDLIKVFGINIFEDKDMTKTLKELSGIEGYKPFECVGTENEVKEAIITAYKSKQYPELVELIKSFGETTIQQKLQQQESLMPDEFQEIINQQ